MRNIILSFFIIALSISLFAQENIKDTTRIYINSEDSYFALVDEEWSYFSFSPDSNIVIFNIIIEPIPVSIYSPEYMGSAGMTYQNWFALDSLMLNNNCIDNFNTTDRLLIDTTQLSITEIFTTKYYSEDGSAAICYFKDDNYSLFDFDLPYVRFKYDLSDNPISISTGDTIKFKIKNDNVSEYLFDYLDLHIGNQWYWKIEQDSVISYEIHEIIDSLKIEDICVDTVYLDNIALYNFTMKDLSGNLIESYALGYDNDGRLVRYQNNKAEYDECNQHFRSGRNCLPMLITGEHNTNWVEDRFEYSIIINEST